MEAFLANARSKFSARARFPSWSAAQEDALRGLSKRGFICRREQVDLYSKGRVSESHVEVTAVHMLCLLAVHRSPTAPESTAPHPPRSETAGSGEPA